MFSKADTHIHIGCLVPKCTLGGRRLACDWSPASPSGRPGLGAEKLRWQVRALPASFQPTILRCPLKLLVPSYCYLNLNIDRIRFVIVLLASVCLEYSSKPNFLCVHKHLY